MCLAFMTANGGHRLSTLIICVPSEIFITLKLLKPIAYIIFFLQSYFGHAEDNCLCIF